MKNKYEFMFFIQAKNCNPNGDPDAGNQPRMDAETGLGYITDVAIKRRIRNYVDEVYSKKPGMDIIMKDGAALNREIAHIITEVTGEFPKNKTKGKDTANAAKKACELFYDVRAFGGVLSTGKNAGQIKGPVQFEFAQSLDEILPQDKTITRMCYTDEPSKNGAKSMEEYDRFDKELDNDKKRTMGRKQFIPYGLYVCKGYLSACIAEKTGFSEKDFDVLLEAIMNMYELDHSASKTGMSIISPLIIFKHVGTQSDKNSEQNIKEAMLGCAPAYKLFELINIHQKEEIIYPRDYRDYFINIDMKNIPNGVEIGFKENAFENIVWNKIPERETWINK